MSLLGLPAASRKPPCESVSSPSRNGSDRASLHAAKPAVGELVDVQDNDVIAAVAAELAGHVHGRVDVPGSIPRRRVDCQHDVLAHRALPKVITSLPASMRPGRPAEAETYVPAGRPERHPVATPPAAAPPGAKRPQIQARRPLGLADAGAVSGNRSSG
jgi:hypothetical protein